ncbi:hypothetical protein C8J57DRAFT_1533980 [Mycena rebaudengoi]|nr:hypothetical protein C8J57DRAFT_1533980 [Mycena rebaudengoi]
MEISAACELNIKIFKGPKGVDAIPIRRNLARHFSIITANVTQHLIISYHKIAVVESGRLRTPSSLSELASLDALLEKGNFGELQRVLFFHVPSRVPVPLP